jgi:hypothetical protein
MIQTSIRHAPFAAAAVSRDRRCRLYRHAVHLADSVAARKCRQRRSGGVEECRNAHLYQTTSECMHLNCVHCAFSLDGLFEGGDHVLSHVVHRPRPHCVCGSGSGSEPWQSRHAHM